jgi:cytochrome c biogenesis protein CcmG, thiol:disulfide interchange protein DsbE
MMRSCLALLAFGASSLFGQSRVDLLQRVASHYENADSFDVRGTASALIPGSSWEVSYDFETEAAQPWFVPLNTRGPSMQEISIGRQATQKRVRADARDPEPQRDFDLIAFGRLNDLAAHLIDAQKVGTETINVRDRVHSYEIIAAVYDMSPKFKPHSLTVRKTYWIDPSDLSVLRVTQSADGLKWTADVTSISFDQPPSDAMIQALKRFAAQATNRPEWIGRSMPDLTLAQLAGSPVGLRGLRGRAVLLDFWASYCGPCRRTTLHAQELAERYRSAGLTVLTLTQDTPRDARLWADYYHVNLPVLLDPDGAAFKAFDVQGVPVAILIDKDGKVVRYWVGLDNPTAMDPIVSATLQVVPAAGLKRNH